MLWPWRQLQLLGANPRSEDLSDSGASPDFSGAIGAGVKAPLVGNLPQPQYQEDRTMSTLCIETHSAPAPIRLPRWGGWRTCALPFAVALASASLPAAADPSGPLGCDGHFGFGGCPPYEQLLFFGDDVPNSSTSVFEYDPVALDQTITSPYGTARGVVDLASGTVKTYAQVNDDNNRSIGRAISVTAQAVDVFTLHSLGSPSADNVSFGFFFRADGIGDISQLNSGGLAFLHLGGTLLGYSGGVLDDLQHFAEGTTAPYLNDFPIHLMTFANLTAPLDLPFDLSFLLRTDVGEGTSFNFLHTARISFVLPEGVYVTSMGGYSSLAVTPVPEPSTWLLMAAGLAVITRLKDRQQRQPV